MNNKDLEKIRRILSKDKNIVLAVVFGSQATGAAGPISDVDIAVLLKKNQESYFAEKIKYLGKIKNVLKRDDIDLVIINQAPPFLNYMIMKTGKVIYEKSRDDYHAFNIRAMRAYEDNKHLLNNFNQDMVERIKNGTFGIPINI